MAIYRISTTEGPWGFLHEGPRMADGSLLKRRDLDAASCEMRTRNPRPIPDVVKSAGGILMFSSRLQAEIDKRLEIPTPGAWIPVGIHALDGEPESFFALTSRTKYDVIDLERSEFTWLVPDKVLGQVTKWVLDDASIPSSDIFMASEGTWLVSSHFVDLARLLGCSGAEFSVCETG